MGAVASQRVRFNILGPLECWSDGVRVRLGGPVQERVLSALLLESGRVLPVSRLVDFAWPDNPPATAPHQVRKAIADLRQRIPGGAGILRTEGAGYRAAVPEGGLDLAEFDAGVRESAEAERAGRREAAAAALRAALDLWRGPAASCAAGPLPHPAAAALEERRLGACERLAELRLGLGQGRDILPELRESVARNPLRETPRAQLMIALCRAGRRAEALKEYEDARTLLAEEIGVCPGGRLRETYEAVLSGAPVSGASGPPEPAPRSAPAGPEPVPCRPPCSLPNDLPDFTGRDAVLLTLTARVTDAAAPGAHRLVAVDGMGGCGKSALAVHAAHRLSAAFPDGRLHVDLGGRTPGGEPLPPVAVLGVLLRDLGVPADRIPGDLAGRSALWRAATAGRRLLVVLDHAADAAAVRALAPASPGCATLVTSRVRLVDLDGAVWLCLGVLEPSESIALLRKVLGRARVDADPVAAAELARLCGHLPLALRIAAARLHNRPLWPLGHLTGRLRDATRRLSELTMGERSVAAALNLSYLALGEDDRAAFRVLARYPGAALDVPTAAALTGRCAADAEALLELLLDVHLAEQREIGRYRLPDLVRSFGHTLPGPDAAPLNRLTG